MNLHRVYLPLSVVHESYESLQYICYFLLVQSDEHDVIDIMDQSNGLWNVKTVQIFLEYIMTNAGELT